MQRREGRRRMNFVRRRMRIASRSMRSSLKIIRLDIKISLRRSFTMPNESTPNSPIMIDSHSSPQLTYC
jgi:hypothetical protein